MNIRLRDVILVIAACAVITLIGYLGVACALASQP